MSCSVSADGRTDCLEPTAGVLGRVSSAPILSGQSRSAHIGRCTQTHNLFNSLSGLPALMNEWRRLEAWPIFRDQSRYWHIDPSELSALLPREVMPGDSLSPSVAHFVIIVRRASRRGNLFPPTPPPPIPLSYAPLLPSSPTPSLFCTGSYHSLLLFSHLSSPLRRRTLIDKWRLSKFVNIVKSSNPLGGVGCWERG